MGQVIRIRTEEREWPESMSTKEKVGDDRQERNEGTGARVVLFGVSEGLCSKGLCIFIAPRLRYVQFQAKNRVAPITAIGELVLKRFCFCNRPSRSAIRSRKIGRLTRRSRHRALLARQREAGSSTGQRATRQRHSGRQGLNFGTEAPV